MYLSGERVCKLLLQMSATEVVIAFSLRFLEIPNREANDISYL